MAPGPGPGSASSSLRGALPWRPDHPTVARGSSQQANWRWFRPPRLAHRAQTPGRPVRAKLDHATLRVRPDSTRFDACRAAPLCAPTSLDMDNPLRVAPCSCSKLALNSCAVSDGGNQAFYGAISSSFIAFLALIGIIVEFIFTHGERQLTQPLTDDKGRRQKKIKCRYCGGTGKYYLRTRNTSIASPCEVCGGHGDFPTTLWSQPDCNYCKGGGGLETISILLCGLEPVHSAIP